MQMWLNFLEEENPTLRGVTQFGASLARKGLMKSKAEGVMVGREGRLARRIPLRVRVILETIGASGPIEVTYTENVSPQGACAVTANPWRAKQELIVSVAQTGLRRRARVAYCQRREDGKFIIGVYWHAPPVNWSELSKIAVS